jgi:AcrR family transcriptional regulator
MTQATSPPPRSTYRHGDLRRALLEAGAELARDGGPDAVVLREATRRAGVVPNAAYRHFANREELLRAVRHAALSALAVAMETALAGVQRRGRRPADVARAGLRALGIGYLGFARTEPGLFRMFRMFASPEFNDGVDPAAAGASGLAPIQLLNAALDKLVETGVLAAARRPGAEYLAWSAVHGLAMLITDGPMSNLSPAEVDDVSQRLVEMMEKGLSQ